jgi:hypothetical protein
MLRVHITDPNGNKLVDGEPLERRMTGVNWSTMWPKGYGPFGSQIRRDIMARNPLYAGCKLAVKWNGRSVYEGRLNAPQQSRNGTDGFAKLTGQGFYVYMAERQLRKRWIDLGGIGYLEVPAARLLLPEQKRATIVFNDKDVKVMPVDTDIDALITEQVHLEYVLPAATVRRIKFSYSGRSGEGFSLLVYNEDQSAEETTAIVQGHTPVDGNLDWTFVQGDTRSFTFRIHPYVNDQYDQNDWLSLLNLEMRANYHPDHSAYGSPLYTTDELLEDTWLYLRESSLSADVDGLAFGGVTMTNFGTLNDGYETGDSLIQRLLRYGGDNEGLNDQTLGLCVWGSDESSDGLPKGAVTARNTDDYEYIVDPTDRNVTFDPEESEAALYNYIIVQYEDASGRTRYLTPDDDSDLTDAASVAQYGKRMPPSVLNAGPCDADAAAAMGRRALEFHKDLLDRVSLTVQGIIKTKEGLTVPACYVRSGDRVKVKGYQGGKIYFIRTTGFDAESQTVSMTSDLPPLMIETLVNRPSVE